MATTEIGRPNGKLVMPDAGTTRATVEVIYQSHATRVSRAIIVLAVSILIAPVLYFLPPHFLWPVVSIALGAWLAWRYWNGEYFVTHFEGACPRCDTPLEMPRGTSIRREHTLVCPGCQGRSTLIVNDPENLPEEEAAAGVVMDEASDRRAPARDRRSTDDRRDIDAPDAPDATPSTSGAPSTAPETPSPTSDEPTAVLDEPARRPDELGG